jgi:hypothetical protein
VKNTRQDIEVIATYIILHKSLGRGSAKQRLQTFCMYSNSSVEGMLNCYEKRVVVKGAASWCVMAGLGMRCGQNVVSVWTNRGVLRE